MGLVLKKRRSKKQQIWEYMRRNRQFRVGELMMILDLRQAHIASLFRTLELAEYLQLKTATEVFRDRIYQLKKDTGVHAPMIKKFPCEKLQDLNTGKEIVLDGSYLPQVADKLKLLYAMSETEMTREQISKISGVNLYSAKLYVYLKELHKYEVFKKVQKFNQPLLLSIDKEKRDELISTLEKSM